MPKLTLVKTASQEAPTYEELFGRIRGWSGATDVPKSSYTSDMPMSSKVSIFNKAIRDAAISDLGGVTGVIGTTIDDVGGHIGNTLLLSDIWSTNNFSNSKEYAMTSRPAKYAVDDFVSNLSMDNIQDLQKNRDTYFPPDPTPGKRAVASYMTQRISSRVGTLIKEDPIKNMPKAVGLYLRDKKLNKAADYVEKPWLFYGALGLLLSSAAATTAFALWKRHKRRQSEEETDEEES